MSVVSRLMSSASAAPRLSFGVLVVGVTAGHPGVRAWIDEFKILAEQPAAEAICDHAQGNPARCEQRRSTVRTGGGVLGYHPPGDFAGADGHGAPNQLALHLRATDAAVRR